MKTVWTINLSEQQQQEVRKEYASSPVLRERLIKILNDKLDVAKTGARSKIKYESASWPYYQADNIGYERAIIEVISLITTKSVE